MIYPKVDYLKLLAELDREQYGTHDDEEDIELVSEPIILELEPIKRYEKHEIIKLKNFERSINLTDTPKAKLLDGICNNSTIIVGDYTFRITHYNGKYPVFSTFYVLKDLTLDFEIYHKVYKTPSGNPCNLDIRTELVKDSRFTRRPWLHYFTGSHARGVPIETVVDMVKWFQVIRKLTAFL